MAQTYGDLTNADALTVVYEKLNDNNEAHRSGFSGASQPTTPTPVEGQRWFDSTNDVEAIFTPDFSATNRPVVRSCYSRRFTIGHASLTEASNGVAQAITLDTFPAGTIIRGVVIKHSTAFSGGGLTALTVEVGITAIDSDGYASAFDIFQATGDTVLQCSDQYKALTWATQALVATFRPDASHDLNDISAGSVDIWIAYEKVAPAVYF